MEVKDSDHLDREYRDFFRAIRDEDSFTLLYELTYRDEPVAVEPLARQFGSDVRYILEVLGRLERLKVAGRLGKRWVASKWARTMLRDVEERLATVQLEAVEASSAGGSVYLMEAIPAATHNGFWSAGVSPIGALEQRSAGGALTSAGDADRATGFASVNPELAHNETRTHDYR